MRMLALWSRMLWLEPRLRMGDYHTIGAQKDREKTWGYLRRIAVALERIANHLEGESEDERDHRETERTVAEGGAREDIGYKFDA